MGTSSNRSAGTQVTKNGVTQGNVLVDPVTGYPIDVIKDSSGVRRLAVDADLTADSIVVDTRDLSPTTDAVGVGDKVSGYFLKVNSDGSINTDVVLNYVQDSITVYGPGTVVSTFNSVTSVASSVLTTLTTYTVPAGKTANLQRLEVSGTNIAQYDVLINSILSGRRRTYFGAPLNETFDFSAETDLGLPLNAGDNVQITVIHQRPDVGDFEGRIQVVQVG